MTQVRLLLPLFASIWALAGYLVGTLAPNSALEAWLSLVAMVLLVLWIFRLEQGNLLSFASLFALFFFLYTAAPTAQRLIYPAFQGGNPLLEELLGGWEIPLGRIGLLGFGALLSFGIGLGMGYLRLGKNANDIARRSFPSPAAAKTADWLYGLGIVFFLLGVILYLLDLGRLGGLQAILVPRVERLYALAEARVSLPFAPVLFSGLALAFLGWIRQGGKRGASLFVLLSLWIVFLLLQGDRRFVLYTVLILVGVLSAFKGFKLTFSLRLLFYGIGAYFLMAFFGSTRWLLTPLLQGSYSLKEACSWVAENISSSWFLPFNNEFAGPYTTLVFSLEDPQWQMLAGSPLMGLSYLMALPNLLPRSLYPGEKWQTLSFRFSDYTYESYLSALTAAPIGLGFSPLAEAVLNFGNGLWAPLAFFFLLGLFAARLSRWARRRPFPGGIVYALLLPQAFNLNRIDFAWSFQEAFYYGVTSWTLWWLGNLLLNRRTHEQQEENT